jgi:hypothetical protein
MMSKMQVFSREKYLSEMDKIAPDLAEGRRGFQWPFECDGKTKEECNALGYSISGNWMEEKEMGYKEKQADWLKKNDLREGSRVYVYRKPENYEDGWRYAWIDSLMDKTVGKVANIMEIHPCSLLVKVGDKTYYMPYTAMLPVGVTEFEVGRRYRYVGTKTAEYFSSLHIDPRDATLIASGEELMVETFEEDKVKFTTTSHRWHFKGNWQDFVALPEKDYYTELNRWIKTNGLKMGDKVRLLRSPTLEDMEGWGCDWFDGFDKYIGEPLMVVGFDDEDHDIEVLLDDGHYIYVPYTVLEKVERSAHGTLVDDIHASLDAMGIKVLSVELNDDNHITIEGVIR